MKCPYATSISSPISPSRSMLGWPPRLQESETRSQPCLAQAWSPGCPTMNTQHAAGVRDGHEAPDRARSRRISQGPMRPPFQRDPHTTAMPMPSTATASKRKATARRGMPPKFWNRCTKTGPPGSTWKDLGPPTNRRIETAEAALWRPPASTAAASVNSAAHPMSPRTSTGHRRCVGIGAARELTP